MRAVLFDFYGTLARAVSWGEPHDQIFARRGLAFDPAIWAAGLAAGVDDGDEHVEHSRSRRRYVAWERDRLRRRARACGVGEDDVEALVDDLYAANKAFVLKAYDEVPDVLGELRRRRVRVAVCSNWDWDIDRAVAAVGLDHLLDVVVTSARAGARKPHPRIFRHTLARVGVAAADALFVGDSFGPDVEGPAAYGFRAVHVARDDDMRDTPPLPPGAARVGDLRGVPDLL